MLKRIVVTVSKIPSLRAYSSNVDSYSKSMQIQSSIKLYLKRVHNYEAALEHERVQYERGRRYLAQLMGEDPETFSQDKIDEAIRYLFPSGLFSLKARPKLKPPDEVFPKQKKLQYDSNGRPFHDMFYTRQPHFFQLMNEAVYELENLKHREDLTVIGGSNKQKSNPNPLLLVSTNWLTKPELENKLSETLFDEQYEQWLSVMNRIATHPHAQLASAFVFRYRAQQRSVQNEASYPEPEVDPVTGQKFIKAYGQKRHSFAEAVVRIPGSGQVSINQKRLLEVFPELGNREQIMFPLQLTKTLGIVDLTATVTGEGSSSNANALRTAISRCLASLLPEPQGKRPLQVAGLLTQDERFGERKKPGQKKARKKPIWKAR